MIKYNLLIFALGVFFTANLFSQEIYITTDTTIPPEIEIGEVIIAASKSNSQLKQLPASVSLISSNTIETNQIKTLDEVTGLAANFIMPDYGSKLTSPVYIRGVGSRINSPSIGLYVDNVPYFEKAAFNFDFFDIEQLEILRGPQGTLYGRNSMGGLINVITKSPANYQGTHLLLSAGNFGVYNLNASHYNKINEKIAFSIATNYLHNDGFYTNEFIDKKVDNMNSYGFRSRFIYTNKKIRIENIANYEHCTQGGYPYSIFNDSLNRAEDVNYNQKSTYDRKIFSDAINFNYDATNWELTNTLSYQYLDDAQKIDQDFTPDSLYFVEQYQIQNMFADELIFKSKGEKRYNWLFGAFGFNQIFDRAVEVDVFNSNMWYVKNYDLTVTGIAFFHQSTFNITNYFKITAGLRYDNEVSEMKYKYDVDVAGNLSNRADTSYPKLEDNILLPKVALSYEFDNATIYTSYTTGYKPGGFNSTFELPEHLMFTNENSHNFEIGTKSSFFSKLMYTDFAIFYTKLENQQIYRTVPSGRGSYLDNAGLSENKGFEITLKNRAYAGFQAMVSYGYTHSKILEYVKDSTTNYNDKYTPYIPRHTMAINISQTINLKTNIIDKLRFNVIFKNYGEMYWDLDNTYKEESYNIVDAKISLIKNRIQFDIWGKNLLSTEYKSFLFEALGNTYTQIGKPLHVGVNFSIKF